MDFGVLFMLILLGSMVNIHQMSIKTFSKQFGHGIKAKTGRDIADFKALAFHLPFTKMGLKALRDVLPEATNEQQVALMDEFEA